MKKQNMIIGVVIVIFILLLGVFYYLSEIAVADDGIVSPIEPDDEEPDGLTEFEGYWKQQILISYVDGTEEYLGSGVFDGTTLSIIRGGKGIESIDYLLNVKIMPSLDIEGVKFDLDALIIVLDLGGYETLSRIVSSGDMIDETISDDGRRNVNPSYYESTRKENLQSRYWKHST